MHAANGWKLTARRYSLAVVAVMLAVLLHFALEPSVGAKTTLLVLMLPAFAAAMYGGLAPGLFATALSTFVVWFFFLEPTWSFALARGADRLRIVIFLLIGACASTLGEARLRAGDRLAAALEREREARKEAERLARVKDEFISTVSHELRTPLNAILGWTHLLRPRADERARHGLDVIERNARAEARIVGDLLDASRAWSGKLQIHRGECDFAGVVRDTVDSLAPSASARGVHLAVELPRRAASVDGDADRLAQVVRNLVDNAIKFSPRGARVDVRLGRSEGRTTLEVIDHGEGMDPNTVRRLFDKFQQADSSSTRRHAGLGLGLYLSKAIVTAHGGTIHAESSGRGGGSRFWLTLPRASGKSVEIPRMGIETPRLQGVRVLLVDDDPDSGEVVRRILGDHGATVDLELAADPALGRWNEIHHSVIVSDLSMPDRDGFWLAREIRARENGVRPRLIALSALVHPDDRERARGAGFDIFLSKPLDPQALLQAVAP